MRVSQITQDENGPQKLRNQNQFFARNTSFQNLFRKKYNDQHGKDNHHNDNVLKKIYFSCEVHLDSLLLAPFKRNLFLGTEVKRVSKYFHAVFRKRNPLPPKIPRYENFHRICFLSFRKEMISQYKHACSGPTPLLSVFPWFVSISSATFSMYSKSNIIHSTLKNSHDIWNFHDMESICWAKQFGQIGRLFDEDWVGIRQYFTYRETTKRV